MTIALVIAVITNSRSTIFIRHLLTSVRFRLDRFVAVSSANFGAESPMMSTRPSGSNVSSPRGRNHIAKRPRGGP